MLGRRGVNIMMGRKERHFAPLIHVSLEELVLHNHLEGLRIRQRWDDLPLR